MWAEIKSARMHAGLCVNCLADNDSKDGHEWCLKCRRDRRSLVGPRVAVDNLGSIEAMERALGMPVTGRGGRDIKK